MSQPDDDALRAILTGVRTIAMVGASAKPDRPSRGVMQFLQGVGYRVIPVNPGLAGQTLLGETVRASLRDVGEPIDMVDVFRTGDAVPEIIDDAIAIGAKVVWTQLGVVHQAAAARGRDSGLQVIMDRCPVIEWRRLGLSRLGL